MHLFGAVSSPSIANFALKQTGRDHSDHFSNEVFDAIKNSFYVDGCLKSVASTSQAIKLTKDLCPLLAWTFVACAQGGFTLTKWVSNSQEVLTTVPESHRAKVVAQLVMHPILCPIMRSEDCWLSAFQT